MSASGHLFWIASRGAGITALLLASTAVCYGLLMAGRVVKGSATDRRAYHEMLGLSVMVATAVHGLTLLGDGYLHPSLLDITIPFALGYERVATTLGIVAGWALVALGLSFYIRNRIGRERFKLIHRFTLLAWLAGLVHTLIEGTDAGQLWFLVLLAITTAPLVLLLVLRATGARLGRGAQPTTRARAAGLDSRPAGP
ncbi:MAG: ferric reductase-like transmembrane domain-containing protein [Solirubrobacterales bacterium]|nr:ferric reductase-like transmembrane domain-containing protein [Solirubrobacterales bacterium]